MCHLQSIKHVVQSDPSAIFCTQISFYLSVNGWKPPAVQFKTALFDTQMVQTSFLTLFQLYLWSTHAADEARLFSAMANLIGGESVAPTNQHASSPQDALWLACCHRNRAPLVHCVPQSCDVLWRRRFNKVNQLFILIFPTHGDDTQRVFVFTQTESDFLKSTWCQETCT